MSCLLYAIFGPPLRLGVELPTGVAGLPVEVVSYLDLGVAVSELPGLEPPADVPSLVAHEQVVEFFFRLRTVIPLRFGAMAGERREVTALLETRQAEYRALLQALDGFAEMGIQLLIDGAPDRAKVGSTAVSPPQLPSAQPPGASYLLAKKLSYRNADRMAEWESELVEALCASLAGLFRRRKVERSSARSEGLLSLYFLVPQSSVEEFRKASLSLKNQSFRLLLSGPWPPYNFVDSSDGGAIL
ncbi:MAG: GvpL/GvpF family gas vesicle protein [Acidobacteriia bacterium]|nr:GvpL/GvpF family gas vesicle protein [Terriglobia bacterium]